MKRLFAALLLLAMPAQAEMPDTSPEWRACFANRLESEKPITGSAVMAALNVTRPCRSLYRGERGGDMDFAVRTIEEMMVGLVVSPPTPMSPADKRF